jgi:hypothetical protein
MPMLGMSVCGCEGGWYARENFLPADRTAFLRGDSCYRSSHPPATLTEVAELSVTIRQRAVPAIDAHPHDPAVGPDGSLWFTEQMVNKLGRLDPKTGEFKEYPLVEGKNSGPHGMVADRDGNIWFTANFGGYIGKPEYGGMRVISFLAGHGVLRDLAGTWVDANGMLWFTVQGGNMVGRLDPKTGKIELKEVPTEGALPYGIQINSKVRRFSANLAPTRWHPSIRRPWPSRNTHCLQACNRGGWRLLRMIRSISRISRAATWAR